MLASLVLVMDCHAIALSNSHLTQAARHAFVMLWALLRANASSTFPLTLPPTSTPSNLPMSTPTI
ncbi:hypothetical protein M378DRAFT_163744 [Amanita muscaria Koide BX008]|uniref:Uncharacterized protein n=1 Tax=Amanita muscaria (strain Koide BX008) TaxID=946122 RepID=A0A0C2X5N1_AMAMK|nr:hypothetical protein M378DRAFT_163744 [Amanita muscaria Koide BX008]